MKNILILGASYGLLLGAKLSLAGHEVTLVGRGDEIAAMAQHPLEVRIAPRRTGDDIVLTLRVGEQPWPGCIALTTPGQADPVTCDLVILAMQEPQYRDPAVAGLMARIAASGRPCLSIMNLAPPPFLKRLGIDAGSLAGVYHSAEVWAQFDPRQITLASPDPQAIRPDPATPWRLHCTLPSNFKAAPFARAQDQALLQQMASDMSHLEVVVGEATVRPPVALIASPSLFVPLTKWPMLIAGNCRCVLPAGIQTIAEAVLTDLAASAAVYDQVCQLVLQLGAQTREMVPFRDYAKAASRLVRPSSLARAIEAGAGRVERIDRLISSLMAAQDVPRDLVNPVVDVIERRLELNRAVQESALG